ncbi:4-hydroxybenzoyl-CoA thioesterase protein [Salinisphaera shabanensis E1L3A]|uniref:4-hydroxybenzoyl-CoA thioesterase protein n=1 Tax=Salinisphaera shabanensis E1L3A TaxID=1033802 RepID=U2EPD5_9GAMM|nr:thioesterase family protein [Salinisphaera shabanensis]ERJ19957.1 4-hydroxybenzoyl-CoA thioesterase protein [Salinisphaera shabanensis E1L3A]
MARTDDWDIDTPFVTRFVVGEAHIDRLNHMNNAVYLSFLEKVAWQHTEALGIGWQSYVDLDAACVVHRHELDYLIPAYLGDELDVATWIEENDGRLAMWRGFQMRRVADGRTIFRARTHYVTVKLSNGRPRRMPQMFVDAYRPAVAKAQ